MKKSSKMPKRMRETIGIDLGDKVSRYCMVDQDGEVMEEGTFRNQTSSIEKHFGDRPRRIALEAGAQSAWISRELKRLGHEVIVANPRELKWITSSDTKNDPVDARKLALLARADVRLLTPVEHRSAEQQAELAVIRGRDAILRARTLLINSARSIAKGFGVRLPKSITHTFGERAVDALPEFLRSALTGLLEQIDAISRAIAGYDQQIVELAAKHPELERLESIPGVGRLTAMTFVLTLGRVERFAHSRDVAGFLGLRPKQRQSGVRDPQLGIAKSGDPYLRKLLVQCAHHILGHYGKDSALRQWGLAKSEGGKKATLRAIVAVARKLSVLLHRLWVSGEYYKPFPKMA
ncbi:MAG TPA: IS110 family transposase [Bryobacteraceae bacterium]|nr:IS110 family transposase [Bryobacteraceae bacterium]